jgi:hypothetical protein
VRGNRAAPVAAVPPLGAGQLPFLPWPWLHERRAAAQAVGEVADRQRVSLRRVVFHDHPEILQHQKARALGAGGRQQIGLVARVRESPAVGALEAKMLPLRDVIAFAGPPACN